MLQCWAQAWRCAGTVARWRHRLALQTPKHNETIDVFYIKKKKRQKLSLNFLFHLLQTESSGLFKLEVWIWRHLTQILFFVIGPWDIICLHMTTQQQKQQGHNLSGVETEHIRAAFEWQRVHVNPPDFLHSGFSSTYFVRSENKKKSIILLYTTVVKLWSAYL